MRSRRILTLTAITMAVMALTVACGSSDDFTAEQAAPTATPIPSPTPSPTPTPPPTSPISIDPRADVDGFLAEIPANEVTCAADAVGGRQRLADLLSFNDDDIEDPTGAEIRALERCVSDETFTRAFTGQLIRISGGLTDETVECVTERTSHTDFSVLLGGGEDADPTAAIGIFQAVFCLNSAERQALETSSGEIFSFESVGSIDALECFVDGVGPTQLAEAGSMLFGDGELGAGALSDALGFFPVALECGLIDDSELEDAPIDVDQVVCLSEALGDSADALLLGEQPDFSDLSGILAALTECGVELDDLLSGSDSPFGSLGDDNVPVVPSDQPEATSTVAPVAPEEFELPFTIEQIECLTNELGDEVIQTMLAGGTLPLTALAALTTCGISLQDLLGA